MLVATARIDTQKRPLLVPDIIHQIREDLLRNPSELFDDVMMYMLGDGPIRGALEERIAHFGLEDHVRILGNVDQPELILKGADIFLLPSFIEGISIAIAEAMALGLPIVTTYAGGLPEQLGYEGEGQLAEGGRLIHTTGNHTQDAQQYAKAVVDLARDGTMRLGVGMDASGLVRREFDQDITLPGFFTEMLLAAKAPKPSIADTPK